MVELNEDGDQSITPLITQISVDYGTAGVRMSFLNEAPHESSTQVLISSISLNSRPLPVFCSLRSGMRGGKGTPARFEILRA